MGPGRDIRGNGILILIALAGFAGILPVCSVAGCLFIFISKIFISKIIIAKVVIAEIVIANMVAAKRLAVIEAVLFSRGLARFIPAKIGRCHGAQLRNLCAEIRKDGLLLNLTFAQGEEVVGEGLFFVEANLASIGAHETFIEDAAGKLVEVFVLEGAQHAGADFGGVGDGIEGEAALLALFAKFFSERSQGRLRRTV